MSHPALTPGRTAVVTGAASGIGLAAARRFAGLGLAVVLADLPGERLDTASGEIADLAPEGRRAVKTVATDVSKIEDLRRLREAAEGEFGDVAVVMNNAAIDPVGKPWENYGAWQRLIAVNLWGVVNGVQAFAPAMAASGKPGLIVNTGSKQGITTPPGNAAYNVSKAAVKAFTEATAHELRNTPGCRTSAHLLIPGFTFTGLTKAAEKPDAAWTADEVVDFMLASLERGDFYILCPDNDVTRETDEKRMRWAIGDIVENRPALSRWHPDYKEAFERFMTA
ncbi:MAG TPA: SDR family NAD(P)-dependent oxidoreductase [Lichenihabitans sp.]|jgi:NAD(P)-dependent dehydrogenase (short-subunit alcohol dehydrogenase family)|nr:SDR family NAD(P)-dependent oxidoreductase [Lichenihabitans sp.]